ncbi:hypothetical protein G7Y89_g4792 [Cudoniella acicularis]|uniref:Peptidase A1 domain-containing protein n=1 Tax=Cudoniella acicularis TaxID=354080 RepID=A0A8H4RQS3_9HELO|nr:hypothetical protein G7Y89_g4792 [Cudoniella acicularis]
MHTSLVLAGFSLANLCLAEPGFLSLKTYRNTEAHAQALRKRSSFPVTLGNYPYAGGGIYFVNATVGSPAQEVQLQIDTGSSDVWMFGVHSCDSSTSPCLGGAFDISASQTATILDEGGFQIQYVTAGSGVTGDYIGDSFTIGGTTIKNLTMGVSTKAVSVDTGIMGIGFDAEEAIVGQEVQAGNSNPQPYPNFIDELKLQGLIGTKSYSLYLDDLETSTGSIIFGGYDKAKFQGDLGILTIQPDSQSGTYSSFGVILNSMGVTDSTGSTVISSSSMPNVVILDSGTAYTVLPPDIFNELVAYFGALKDKDYGLIIQCDLNGMAGTLDYQFAGPTGPIVSVPFSELAIPIVDPETGESLTDNQNNPVCHLGLDQTTSADEPLLWGDTFLRSAYVVYDLENLQIGIAQTIFNVTSSDVQLITAGSGQSLPGNIASVMTTIVQTKTEGLNGGPTKTVISSAPTDIQSTFGGGKGASALSGYKTTYTNRATNIPSASSTTTAKKSGAAPLNTLASGFWKGMLIQGLVVAAASFIGAKLIL